MRGSRRRHAGDLSAERLGQQVRRGGRAGLAELAQVQCAEDHAQAPGTGRHPARQGWLGLRAGGRTGAAARRHPGAQPRYSGFFNSQLDSTLRARGIRNLVFTGIATNVCVESTLRDGFHLEYFGVVLADAARTRPGRNSPSRRRCTTSRRSSAGSPASAPSAGASRPRQRWRSPADYTRVPDRAPAEASAGFA